MSCLSSLFPSISIWIHRPKELALENLVGHIKLDSVRHFFALVSMIYAEKYFEISFIAVEYILNKITIILFAAMGEMNWIQRKIFLYNVTFGLYMLDWWERCTFNILLIVLMWFVIRYVTEFFRRYVFKQYM
ncbi:hypothetical protein AHAS_Ahas12G0090500 [Arachis hypogaea]|uniref:Uncharacterized protein n=4 Tax=Arachis TaxID=3817 RepID=A0A445AG91_ARAHY|nr:hypothetical protein Ahy_B02g059204 isoform B [Arachis hypogaea]